MKTRALCLCLAGLFPAAAPKASPDAELYVERIQQHYKRLNDFSAEFIQLYSRVALSQTRESRGTLLLKKPDRMRWAYKEPNEKYWIVDGKTLTIYDPEFEEVYIDSNFEAEELSSSIRFFWGKGKLSDLFRAEVLALGAHAGSVEKVAGDLQRVFGTAVPEGWTNLDKTRVVLELTPKKDATYTKLALVLDGRTGEVSESIIFETSGNRNHFRFKNVKIDHGLKDDVFRFDPPPNAEITRR